MSFKDALCSSEARSIFALRLVQYRIGSMIRASGPILLPIRRTLHMRSMKENHRVLGVAAAGDDVSSVKLSGCGRRARGRSLQPLRLGWRSPQIAEEPMHGRRNALILPLVPHKWRRAHRYQTFPEVGSRARAGLAGPQGRYPNSRQPCWLAGEARAMAWSVRQRH